MRRRDDEMTVTIGGRARPAPPRAGGTSVAGLGLALVSAAAFGTSGAFGASLLEGGWSSGATVTLRIAGAALVLLLPAVVALRGRWGMLRRNAGLIVVYGLTAMAGCQLFYFNAVSRLSVGVALLLEYLGVVLVVGWLWVRHRQRPRRWTLVGVGLAVSGLLLVLDVTGGMRVDLVGVMWGLGAAVGLAAYFVLSARQSTGLPPLVMATGGLVVATVALGAAGLVGVMPMTVGDPVVTLAGLQVHWLVPILALALVAAALAYATGIAAVRRLGSKVASFVGLTEVLFAVLFAWFLLGQTMLPGQLVGGALIIAGVVAVRWDELAGARARAESRPVEPVGAPTG